MKSKLLTGLFLSASLVIAADTVEFDVGAYHMKSVDLNNLSEQDEAAIKTCANSKMVSNYLGEWVSALDDVSSSALLGIYKRVYNSYEEIMPEGQKVNKHYIVTSEGRTVALLSCAMYVLDRPIGYSAEEPWISYGMLTTDENKTQIVPVLKAFMTSEQVNFLPSFKLVYAAPLMMEADQVERQTALGAIHLGNVSIPLLYGVIPFVKSEKALYEIPRTAS